MRKFIPFAYIILLVFVIMGPLLKPGYIFLLDFFLSPTYHFDFFNYFNGYYLGSSLPFHLFINVASLALPIAVVEKIILAGFLLISGLAMWYSLPSVLGRIPRLIASTFYIVNPFVYERFIAGQVGVLLGYALLPLILKALLAVFAKKGLREAAMAAALWTLGIVFAPHYIVIVGVAALIIFCVLLERANWFSLVKVGLKVVALLLLFNSYWLVPVLVLKSNVVSDFDAFHFEAYRSASDKRYGLLINLIGMYGFWRERTTSEFILAKDNIPLWPLFFVVFIIPMVYGVKYLYKENKQRYAWSLIIVGAAGLFLSIGPQYGFLGSFNKFVFSYVPMFRGLRESQKFMSIVILVYTILIAHGLYHIKTVSKRRFIYAIIAIAVFVNIFIYNYPLLWAANNQLAVQSYPYSYQKAKEFFDRDKGEFAILVLPWHMYVIGHPLAPKRTIVDPAPEYFYPLQVLASKDEEMGYSQYNKSSQEKQIALLQKSTDPDVWYSYLQKMGIKYVFINKVTDAGERGFDYKFLLQSNELIILVEDSYAILFQIL